MNTSLTAKKILSSTVVVMALAVTSACGGGGDDRPSKDEIVKGLTTGSAGAITKKQAECAAEIVLDSDLSSDALQALADADTKYKASKDDAAQQAKLAEKLTGCLK